MGLIRELRAHIQYKIILPFLLLTLLVALAGAAMAFLFIAGNAQERLDNQLAQVARETSDRLVDQESANLVFLREVAFAEANVRTGAPAVAGALAAGDSSGLERALDPYFRISAQRSGLRVDRMIAFDRSQRSLVDWERAPPQDGATRRIDHALRDVGALWFVPRILAGERDPLGDKYAGLLALADTSGGYTTYLFSAAPVVQGDRVVGGVIVATRIDTLLQELRARSQAAIISLYQAEDGSAFASTTLPVNGLAALNVQPSLIASIRDLDIAQQQSVFDIVNVNERDYQFAYAPLRIRGSVIGIVSVALASDYVTGPWADARLPLTILTITLMLAIIGLGIFIARQITRPLQELVTTAQAVTSGDLERRSQVAVADEIGILSRSFNEMTAHLLDLYRAVRAEASQRAAIVESIADGVVVCDPSGSILVLNQEARALLGLAPDQEGPRYFEEIPLVRRDEVALPFGELRAPDLYDLHDRVVRVEVAPVIGDDGSPIGNVYVLQDMTSAVAMDRAKTNFIATISHELRTPLTVLNGNSELLLRGLVGPLTDEQRLMLETMRRHALTMTNLLNNVIAIAGLESGTLTFEIEPVALRDLLDGMLRTVHMAMATKGLELIVAIPDDLPDLQADPIQLRNVFMQLLDNARRYTTSGTVTIRATHQGANVRVDIADTGCGIAPDLAADLFTRFTRGSQGINSTERGIGLGLAIAKQLIERQGGTLWLEQTSEQGSTFSFSLPCVQSEQQRQNPSLATVA